MLKLLLPLALILAHKKTRWQPLPPSLLILSALGLKLFVPNISNYEASLFFSPDRLATPLLLLTIWMTALIIIASTTTLSHPIHTTPLTTTILVLCLILTISFITNNLMLFYIIFEASLLPTVILIITWGYQPERLQAGTYIIIYIITASFPLLAILTLIFHHNLHLNILMPLTAPTLAPTTFWWLSAILALIVKLPLYTFHLWLPKAHVEAPIAGSIILAGLLLKLGGYGLIRLTAPFQLPSLSITHPLTALTLWGAVLTGFSCLRQTDLKALIAYSSVAHIGLFIAAITSITTLGWTAALTAILAHGLISPILFVLAYISYQTTNTRSLLLTKGIMRILPALTFWWFLAAAANIRAPPTINLLGEILILISVLSINTALAAPIAALTFLTAAYSLHLYTNTQHGSTPAPLTGLLSPPQITHTLIHLHLFPALLLITQPALIIFPTTI